MKRAHFLQARGCLLVRVKITHAVLTPPLTPVSTAAGERHLCIIMWLRCARLDDPYEGLAAVLKPASAFHEILLSIAQFDKLLLQGRTP